MKSNKISQKKKIIQYGDPQDSILGPLLLLIYVNDIDTNISNDTHIKLTFFSEDTSTVITSNDRGVLTFNLDRNSGSILPLFDKNRLIIKEGKLLALGFYHKSNKHTVFPDIILKDGQVTDVS
jgi:hypothetical protein